MACFLIVMLSSGANDACFLDFASWFERGAGGVESGEALETFLGVTALGDGFG